MKLYNRHVHITASVMSILLAFASMLNHGLFEIRQGFAATEGFLIDAIGENDRFWLHGTEAAFTVIPNFFITGIAVVAASLSLIVFAVRYLAIPKGSTVLLAFFLGITMVGGGIGHLVVSLPAWAFSRRIYASLSWFERNMPKELRNILSRFWITSLVVTSLLWLMVMQLGIFGYLPGLSEPDAILNVVFLFLFMTTAFLSVSFLCAMAKDLQKRNVPTS